MRHRVLMASMLSATLALIGIPGAAPADSGSCQILDKPLDHAYEVGCSFIPNSSFGGYGKSETLELDGDWPFGIIKDFGGGDIDFGLMIRDSFFLGSAGLGLPSQLGEVVLDSGFTLRGSNGTAVQLRLQPGLYTDFQNTRGDSFKIPVEPLLVHAFDPDFSGMLGLQVRPGFDRVLMPVVGVAWKINDDLRLDAGVPHSRFQWTIVPDIKTYVGFDWENTSYALAASDGHGDQVTLEDFRVYWGMQTVVSDTLQFSGEIGNVFKRSIEFDQFPSGRIDVGSSVYVRFAVGAPF